MFGRLSKSLAKDRGFKLLSSDNTSYHLCHFSLLMKGSELAPQRSWGKGG
jgi:hypothetical protein